MTAVAFSTTAVPTTTPLAATPDNGVNAILRPLILVGAVAFMVGFMGYMVLGRPHVAEAQTRAEVPAAVSTPAATPTPDLGNPPKPV